MKPVIFDTGPLVAWFCPRGTPMDFADACVVRLAELHAGGTVCTTDGDFRIFRKNGRESISLLAPFAG